MMKGKIMPTSSKSNSHCWSERSMKWMFRMTYTALQTFYNSALITSSYLQLSGSATAQPVSCQLPTKVAWV
jgi:hypothetical protein